MLWLKLPSSHTHPQISTLLKINERTEYKLFSFTYKVLTISQPDYLSTYTTCLYVEAALYPLLPLLDLLYLPHIEITSRSYRYTSPYLWNQLPFTFRQPWCVHSPSGSPQLAHINYAQSPSSLSSLPQSFSPHLKLICFTNPFPSLSLVPYLDCIRGSCNGLGPELWALAFVLVSSLYIYAIH